MGFSDVPLTWGQAGGPAGPSAFTALALRRWYGSLTLSSPDAFPSLFGLWLLLAGVGGLLLAAMIAQGPVRALAQFFDVRGHARLAGGARARLRGAVRMLAATIGLAVLAWTASQTVSYSDDQGRTDVLLLIKSRGLVPLAAEQGALAAVVPLRDVAALSGILPLLVVAGILVFRASVDRMSSLEGPANYGKGSSSWENVAWLSAGLYVLYRVVSAASRTGGLPLGGCLVLEVAVVPALMLVCDGLLLAWVLVELRDAGAGGEAGDRLEPGLVTALLPGAALACLAAVPARYIGTGVILLLGHLPASLNATALAAYVRWQLAWGLAEVQAAALVTAGVAGAVAWSRGSVGEAVRGYGKLLAAEGGRLAALTAASGLCAGAVSAVAYLVLLSMPASPWVLAAADSYAHYATLPIGLFTLAALVELGERGLPEATPVAAAPAEGS